MIAENAAAAATTRTNRRNRGRSRRLLIGLALALVLAVIAQFSFQNPQQLYKGNNEQPRSNATQPTPQNKSSSWAKYRLGDYVLGGGDTAGMKRKPYFNQTLAYDYEMELIRRGINEKRRSSSGNNAPSEYNKQAFCSVVKRRAQKQKQSLLPQANDIVLHLRLGDTIDDNMLYEEVEDVFRYGISIVPNQIRNMFKKGGLGWWHYVKSKCYYEHAIQKIEEQQQAAAKTPPHNKKRRLIIIGSPMHKGINSPKHNPNHRNSFRYAELVRQFLEDHGYLVESKLDGMPDDDMVWMSHSPTFVAAGGGFSKLAADCVEYFGGISLRQEELDNLCWTRPRPADIGPKNYSWETKFDWHDRGGGQKWNTSCKTYPPETTKWHNCS